MNNYDSIADFHNKYAGQRAFLIGNGPSLNQTRLDDLRGEYTFAMNRIALLYETVEWRPTFFVCTTLNVARPNWKHDIYTTMRLGMPAFIWDKLSDHIAEFDNVVPLNCTHGEHIVPEAPDEWWSYDCAQRVCKFGTSMLVAMQLAVYMGFNPIYLVGCDLGFAPDPTLKRPAGVEADATKKFVDPNHFHPDYGTPGCSADQLNMNMRAAHNLARRASQKVGVEIYNASVGGQLDIYPRVSLSSVIRPATAKSRSPWRMPSSRHVAQGAD